MTQHKTIHKLDVINSRDIKFPDDIERKLDHWSQQGWEVVSVCRSGFIDGTSYYVITLRRNVTTDPQGNKIEKKGEINAKTDPGGSIYSRNMGDG